jgi:hypothetical protein
MRKLDPAQGYLKVAHTCPKPLEVKKMSTGSQFTTLITQLKYNITSEITHSSCGLFLKQTILK